MPKQTRIRSAPQQSYWEKRVRSQPFKRALVEMMTQDLQSLAAQRFGAVIDADLVRALIRDWKMDLVSRDVIADVIIRGNRRMAKRLNRHDRSLLSLLDESLVADIDAILADNTELPPSAEDLIANIMGQEFVSRLLTDVMFTAIVSFYQRVNPLFGAIATRVLEEQIRGFIRLFLPTLQERAIAFALSRSNQRILLSFSRSIIRQLLDEPLPHFAAMISDSQRRQAEALIRKAAANQRLDEAIRKAALAGWNDLYHALKGQKVGDIVRLNDHAGWLAERVVDVVLPALSRPTVVGFIAAEMALAAASTESAPEETQPRKRRRTVRT